MDKKFVLLASGILVAGLFLRIIPSFNNNFYFTVDQGRDGVYVRELLEHKTILIRGPETTIRGIFTSPGWYYFIAVGYFLFKAHPFGAVFMLIFLNLAVTAFLIWKVRKRVGDWKALILAGALQFYWFFFDTSRYAFNPFPLVALSIVLMVWLVDFITGERKKYYLAIIPVLLAFNFNIAGAVALFVFYTTIGFYGAFAKKLSWKTYLLFILVLPLLGGLSVLKQAWQLYKNVRLLSFTTTDGVGVFDSTNFIYMLGKFGEIVSNASIPQSVLTGIVVFSIGYLAFIKFGNKNRFVTCFVNLTLVLLVVSYFFFGSNKGWYDWHTVYLPVLLFVSLVLMLVSVPKKIGTPILLLVVYSQLLVFIPRYVQYLKPSNDPGILANQMKVVDWIYSKREDDGFSAYVYTQREFDYTYQYLFWWYGIQKYGFVPCEYTISRKPGFLKHTYVPGEDKYRKPSLGCAQFRFVIVEPEDDQQKVEKWISEQKITENTILIEEAEIVGVKIQKRKQLSQ